MPETPPVWAPHWSPGDHDHHHDHDEDELPLTGNPLWQQDNVLLRSVGMDIGSSGTQVLFSELHLRRISEDLTSRYIVVRRETRYLSPVALTPYADAELIDAGALGGIIDRAYAAAGAVPEEIDTGVVILTGEALRRRNAEAIAGILAERGGELVTAAAGHHMEAMLAAYGSGAAQRSYRSGGRILTVDIGGGTTKLALVEGGRVRHTAAVRIGGRAQVVDAADRIVRLDPDGRRHALAAGYDWRLADTAPAEARAEVAEGMACALLSVLAGAPEAGLYLTEPLPREALTGLDGVLFSGGVAEYVYHRERREFGDLGPLLGRALRRRAEAGELPAPLLPAGECIRATALGASEYSVQLSGNTGDLAAAERLLPRRNLQVARVHCALGEAPIEAGRVAASVREALRSLDLLEAGPATGDVALALEWSGPPSYERVSAFARGVRDGAAARLAGGRPLYLVLDGDLAMTLGRLLREELGVGGDLLVIDGIALREFDWIDIGRVRFPSNTVPVTIKSLVFGEGAD
ncbi:ethanolamine ammonia-lyase reactivating factor EutA [Phaeacidiphilus oryzae]|uniref:ethanolamine ammonia-lyase reactivating factor EutA n=1 Tax=Phaeacidiphilus oryzae TaxID=348818 RepID=UPI000565DAF5|nr:ethanolamine ammonia-lyase reactivating factor EutA [Phaeacidiphilus oryzae]